MTYPSEWHDGGRIPAQHHGHRLADPEPQPAIDEYRQRGEPMADYVRRIIDRMREKLGLR